MKKILFLTTLILLGCESEFTGENFKSQSDLPTNDSPTIPLPPPDTFDLLGNEDTVPILPDICNELTQDFQYLNCDEEYPTCGTIFQKETCQFCSIRNGLCHQEYYDCFCNVEATCFRYLDCLRNCQDQMCVDACHLDGQETGGSQAWIDLGLCVWCDDCGNICNSQCSSAMKLAPVEPEDLPTPATDDEPESEVPQL